MMDFCTKVPDSVAFVAEVELRLEIAKEVVVEGLRVSGAEPNLLVNA